jgi:predicted dienelactone hydrolase
MVTAWYPAVTGTGAAAALLEPATAAALSEGFGLPDLSGLSTYARTDARPKPGARRPVVVLSPGYGLVSELYSSTAEDLGSHGWVVLGVDAGPETLRASRQKRSCTGAPQRCGARSRRLQRRDIRSARASISIGSVPSDTPSAGLQR